jgi:23S rRNA pseudouridine1911/1915/1917 synthase
MKEQPGTGQQEPNNNNNNDDELYERFSITVDKGQEPLRIDKFLINRL